MLKRILPLAVLFTAIAAAASAQAVTLWSFQAHLATTANPSDPATIPYKSMSLAYDPGDCNKPLFPALPKNPEVNGHTFNWSDPINVGMICANASPAVLAFTSAPTLQPAGSTTVAGYVFTMTATNANGTSARSAPSNGDAVVVVVPAAPTLVSLAPGSGVVGTSVTLTGTNFTGVTAVAFNGVPAVFTVTSVTTLAATVPLGATSGVVSVTTTGGVATSATVFAVLGPPPMPAGFQVRP